VLCNPFDTEGLSYRIADALSLPAEARRAAIAAMGKQVRSHDVHHWVAGQIAEITAHSVSGELPGAD
jgi:trehalose 6-phosphate synthase